MHTCTDVKLQWTKINKNQLVIVINSSWWLLQYWTFLLC